MTSSNVSTGFPGVPQGPMIAPSGAPSPLWYQFFVALWNRTGGALGSASVQLNTISNSIGSILYRTSTAWQGLPAGAANRVLKIVGGLPSWAQLDGGSFSNQGPSEFLLSPIASGQPTFRQIQTADLVPIEGQFPGTATDNNAGAGNIGEYIFEEVDSGSAVVLVTNTPNDIASIPLTPGDWDVWATVASAPAGTTTTSAISAWINTVSATDPGSPNGGAFLLQNQAIGAGLGQTSPVGMMRISIPVNTTVYLSTTMKFAVSTMEAYGFLAARRAR